jgi:hypothetical protein
MNIGIVTFHLADNYGAVLQTLALYQRLSELFVSDSIYIVNYCQKSIAKDYSLFPSSVMAKGFILGLCKLLFALVKSPFILKRKYEFTSMRRKSFNYIDIRDIGCLDIVICGSDQIWNPRLTGGRLDSNYFGIINGKTIKAFSYAASDGGSIEDEPPDRIKNLLQNISRVSVREKSMPARLKKYIQDKEMIVSIDPVFLPDKTYWEKMVKKPKCKNYILIYRLEANNEIYKNAYQLAKNTGKKIIEITYDFITTLKNKHKTLTMTGIDQFIGLFMYADYILTNSFHGTAFSIIFNKQFCSYYLKNANERIADLLTDLSISDRQVSSALGMIEKIINYGHINVLVKQKRREADMYLKKCVMCYFKLPPPPPPHKYTDCYYIRSAKVA